MLQLLFIILIAIPLNLVAIGVLTGHTQRALRSFSPNWPSTLQDPLGNHSVAGWGLRIWAFAIFGFETAALLLVVTTPMRFTLH